MRASVREVSTIASLTEAGEGVRVFCNADAAALREASGLAFLRTATGVGMGGVWNEVLREHQRVACATKPSELFQPPYSTSATAELMRELFRLGKVLNTGVAQGKTGTATRLVIGAPGLGKTTALDAFTVIGPTVFEDLVVVNIDCTRLDDLFCGTDLAEAVNAAVCVALNCPLPSGLMSPSSALLAMLTSENKKLLLLLDESQRLYMPGTPEGASKRQRALAYLDGYANYLHRTGKVGALLTGSSVLSRNLLSVSFDEMPDRFFRRFPGAESAPDLNATKFKTCEVLPQLDALFDDTKIVLSTKTGGGRDFTDVEIRALALHTLGNPRSLENVDPDAEAGHPDASSSFASNSAYASLIRKFQSKNADKEKLLRLDLTPLSVEEVLFCIGEDPAGYRRAGLIDSGMLVAFRSRSGQLVFLPRDVLSSASRDWVSSVLVPALRSVRSPFDGSAIADVFEDLRGHGRPAR